MSVYDSLLTYDMSVYDSLLTYDMSVYDSLLTYDNMSVTVRTKKRYISVCQYVCWSMTILLVSV